VKPKEVVEPTIVTANTYFWSPATTASVRRRNEVRHSRAVAHWFRSLGMNVIEMTGFVGGTIGHIAAEFSYGESCSCVRRAFSVTVAGELSNVTTLRKLADPSKREKTLAAAERRYKKQVAAKVSDRLEHAF
jgi:hypothetical protein